MSAVEHIGTRTMILPRRRQLSLIVRWASLVVLLLAELAVFSIRFDTQRLTGLHNVWADVVGGGHLIIQFGISMLAAMLIIRGQNVSHILSRFAKAVQESPMPWMMLITHLGAVALFYRVTQQLLETD